VDANPLSVDPGADLEDCRKLIRVGIAAGGNERIEAGNHWLERAFECRECSAHLSCRDSELAADVDLHLLESGFSPESTDVPRVRYREAAEGFGMPLAGGCNGEVGPSAGVVLDRAENTA
jgi:hypothetical protein